MQGRPWTVMAKDFEQSNATTLQHVGMTGLFHALHLSAFYAIGQVRQASQLLHITPVEDQAAFQAPALIGGTAVQHKGSVRMCATETKAASQLHAALMRGS